MAYYVTDNAPDLTWFGASSGADRWIEQNIKGAKRAPGTKVDLSIPPTEVHPGVTRYVTQEPR